MIQKLYDRKIEDWLSAHRDEIAEELMALVRIPSVRGEAIKGASFGMECQRALEATEKLFVRYGFDTRMEAERGYTLAYREGAGKTIALMAHADVVPAENDWIHTAPFEPIIKNGVIIGRGCGDNKAGIMACLCVMRMVEELNLPVQSKLMAFVGANEETGMADIQSFVKHELLPDVALVADGYFPCSLGERSKLGMWVQSGTPFTAIRDFCGGVSSTVVLGTADVRLYENEALEQEIREKIERDPRYALNKERGGLLLQAYGKPSHAATHPTEGINAAVLAAELLIRCNALPASDKNILQALTLALGDVYGSGAGIAHEDSHFGKLTMANGLAEVRDGCLRLNLDLRYGTELDTDKLIRSLDDFWRGNGWSTEVITRREGCIVEDGHPVPAVICDVYRELTGKDTSAFYMAGGTHAHYIKNGISLGFCVEPEQLGIDLPQGHGGAHQSDEALDINGFLMAIRILTHTVLQSDALLKERE